MPTAESNRPNQRASVRTLAAIVIASTSALACGSGATGSPSDPGTGGTVQIPGGAGKTFSPEGIVYEQIPDPSGDQPGFKLIAATLRDFGNSQELFMTVQNTGRRLPARSRSLQRSTTRR